MLRGLLICPDSELAQALTAALGDTNQAGVVKTLDRYACEVELMRIIMAHAPQIVFVSTESLNKLFETVKTLEKQAQGTQVVAVGRSCDPSLLMELMRYGIREFLPYPFIRESVYQSLARVDETVNKNPPNLSITDQLYAFLPAKQGVGASTVALNTAWALGSHKDTPTLLMDMDLTSGILGFMLKLNPTRTIVDAAQNAHNLDESLWPQLVTRKGPMEVLPTGGLNPEFRVDGTQIRYLLDFARRHHSAICVDLSGNLERYSVEIMHEAKRIFMVVTPEIPTLHLAREKLKYLTNIELGDRISVVLNRNHKRAVITPDQVENLLGVPVMTCLLNDYQGVHRSLQAGRAVEQSSELGRQFASFASAILDKAAHASEPKTRRLVDYLSILPGRYSAVTD
jgi:pilus assembly protein CpaE